MQETIDVVLCTDKNYAMPAAALICSLCERTPAHFVFHLFTDIPDTSFEVKAIKSTADLYDASLQVYEVSPDLIDFVPVGKSYQPGRVSVATYYRLMISLLLPESVHKALYLDTDMICAESIENLWSIDIEDVPLAAVEDVFVGKKEHLRGRTELFGNAKYFNAGVLLINMDYWRESNVFDVFKDIVVKFYERLSFHDQDVLNLAFIDKVKLIDRRYNVYDVFFHEKIEHCNIDFQELQLIRTQPVLVHFCSDMKPWIRGFRHPYASLFLKYKANTPWKRQRLALKKAYSIRERIINILVFLGLHKYNGDYISL